MKAVRIRARGPGGLVYEDVPKPVPGPGEVLVQVRAAAVTAHELDWAPTWKTRDGAARTLAIPGHELSGVVAAAGKGIAGLATGMEVFGLIDDWFRDGALAEYAIARPEGLAVKPANLGHVEAAAIPISGLTAWQALFDRARLTHGQRVLVQGAAGGVGTFAVQLAHLRGAQVFATVSTANADFVSSLGADVTIDYRIQRFEDLASEVDLVLDLVGGETLERSKRVLAPNGRLISVATTSNGTPYFFYVEANRRELTELGELVGRGTIRSIVDAVMPLDRADDAFQRKPQRGKVVVEV
jgi:NADPH:quinone reductase-like Zn-dependent oxidoreductase